MRLYAEAIHVYKGLVSRNIASSTVYGNLGHVYYQVGEAQLAAENYEKAIETDPHNPYPYNNLAKFYFDEYQLEEAKEYAKKALTINRKVYQASTLLAIIYSLEGNSTEADKYSHMAVSSGQNPQKLKAAIEHYKSLENEGEE